jgi:hypothetical protein
MNMKEEKYKVKETRERKVRPMILKLIWPKEVTTVGFRRAALIRRGAIVAKNLCVEEQQQPAVPATTGKIDNPPQPRLPLSVSHAGSSLPPHYRFQGRERFPDGEPHHPHNPPPMAKVYA